MSSPVFKKNLCTWVKTVGWWFRDRDDSNVPDDRPWTVVQPVQLSHAGKAGVAVQTVVHLVDPELVGGDEVCQPLVVRGYQVAVVEPASYSLMRPGEEQNLSKKMYKNHTWEQSCLWHPPRPLPCSRTPRSRRDSPCGCSVSTLRSPSTMFPSC